MLYPVLPLEPPAILEPAQPANSIHDASDTQAWSAAALEQQLTVDYPVQQVEATKSSVGKRPDAPALALPKTEDKGDMKTTGQAGKEKISPSLSISPVFPSCLSAGTLKQNETKEQQKLEVQPAFANAQNLPNSQPIQNIIKFKSRSQTTPQLLTLFTKIQAQSAPTLRINTTNQPQSQPSAITLPLSMPPVRERIIEVSAQTYEYDEQRRIVTVEGNVELLFDGTVVNADRLQVSLDNLIAVGKGNVVLTRGDQILRGQRFTYNFIQDSGDLQNGSGEIYIPSAQTDLSFSPTDVTASGVPSRPLSDRIRRNQPLSDVSSSGGININISGSRDVRNLPNTQKQGGEVRRLRFEAAQIDFYPRGWQARNVRITNDPFSPPELELRADKAILTRESPLRDRIKMERPRLVFDQGLSLPILKDEQVIDRSEREVTPGIFSVGYDGDQRGGVYIERNFKPINTEGVTLSVTPQFFPSKAVQGDTGNIPSLFGLKTKLNATLSPRTVVEGSGVLTSLDLSNLEDNLRASLRLSQTLNERNPHTLTLEYSYRNRLYNGTLGFQTVQSSLGGVITSPIIPLGKSGFNLWYQAGAQYINARTDRLDLLEADRENDRISLGRIQGSATVDGGVLLWQGKALPATATFGLRYTPNPIVPYVRAFGRATGTTSYYSNGDNQSNLTGSIGLEGQFGHFSRPFFDYTNFFISYSQGIRSGESPFLFDRFVDNRVLTAGITQQIYGPFNFGFRTSINLDTGEASSTDYVLEYNRRTYGVTLRYNPVLELGGISFRISDFNWTGGTDPFSDSAEVKPIVDGVQEGNP